MIGGEGPPGTGNVCQSVAWCSIGRTGRMEKKLENLIGV